MLAGSYDLSAGVTINHPVTLEGAMAGVSVRIHLAAPASPCSMARSAPAAVRSRSTRAWWAT